MSPEQYEADPAAIDTRSDVFSLGVVLYELMCGELPYDVSRKPVYEAGRIAREQLPRKPRSIDRSIPADVETIAHQGVGEGSGRRRYQSAAELSHDLDRYLNNLPIEARPTSMLYHAHVRPAKSRAGRGRGAGGHAIAGGCDSVNHFRDRPIQGSQTSRHRQNPLAAQAAIAVATVDFLQQGPPRHSHPYFSPNPELTVREALDSASVLIEHRFDDEPHVEASVRSTLGMTYVNLGQYENAQPHLERTLELRARSLGENATETLTSIHQLAWLRYHQLQYDEADSLLSKALQQRLRLAGKDHADTLESQHLLASLRLRQGRLDEAERLHKETLEARRRTAGC